MDKCNTMKDSNPSAMKYVLLTLHLKNSTDSVICTFLLSEEVEDTEERIV